MKNCLHYLFCEFLYLYDRAMHRCMMVLLFVSTLAWADEPFDPAIGVQFFEPPAGSTTFLTVPDGTVAPKGQFSIDFMVTYLTNPYAVYNVLDDQIISVRSQVVEDLLAGQLSAAYGFNQWLQLGLVLPATFSMQGQGLNPEDGTPVPGGFSAAGLGDIRLEAKASLWKRETLSLSGTLGVGIPTSFGSNDSKYLGDDTPDVRPTFAFQWRGERLSLGASVGAIFRKSRTVFSSTVGQQLTYGVGLNANIFGPIDFIAEGFGRAPFGNDFDAAPLETNGALRVGITSSIYITAGAGLGIREAIGTPKARFFATLRYAPDMGDDDGDGVPNHTDRCPKVKEDNDGFEDNDGCPDDDNDGDMVVDSEDKCISEKEDIDGFQDDDGCPDTDNDGDGIPDLQDECPMYPEDKKAPTPNDGCPFNKADSDKDGIADYKDQCPAKPEDSDGFEDWDGCPDLDNDGDGIEDDADQCPLCPEDKDGFEDEDGCPEFDNDKDGIADGEDQCPTQAETINGIQDDDGCPDSGGALLVSYSDGKISFQLTPEFNRDGSLKKSAQVLFGQGIALMRQHPEVTSWTLVIGAGESGKKQGRKILEFMSANSVELSTLEISFTPETAGVYEWVAKTTIEEDELRCPAPLQVQPRPPTVPGMTPVQPTSTTDDEPELSLDDEESTASTTISPNSSIQGQLPTPLQEFQGNQGELFRRNKPSLRSKGRKRLAQLAELLKRYPNVHVEIRSHTDSRLGKKKSTAISQKQAETALAYLKRKGIAPSRLKAVGMGQDEPIADNKRSSGRRENRRMELLLSIK